MLKRSLIFLAAGFISVASAAQDFVFPQLNGYKIKSDYPVYLPDNLWDFINGAADNYLANGFVDLHVAEYKKGKTVIKAEVYRHSSNTLAFAIYSSERSPSFRFTNLGAQGYIADGSINFFKGNYYVKIRTYSKSEKVLQAEEALANRIAVLIPGEASMPDMLSLFPSEGKKTNEETFINESVLGHSFLNKAFKTSYQIGNDEFSVFILDAASPEAAKKSAETYIASTGISPVETADSKFMLMDGYNGTVFIAWKDKRIVIISGLAKDQADIADRYISDILK
ncbi:MAG TPA: hypothetical protein DEO60_10565 [Bacteroidales bacterium]|nr:hypothetical protein [Bacteroidales bacterium]HBZ21564.1 hypothetical protein [Bacteroidales bacterium]